jgi:hypothetical protein
MNTAPEFVAFRMLIGTNATCHGSSPAGAVASAATHRTTRALFPLPAGAVRSSRAGAAFSPSHRSRQASSSALPPKGIGVVSEERYSSRKLSIFAWNEELAVAPATETIRSRPTFSEPAWMTLLGTAEACVGAPTPSRVFFVVPLDPDPAELGVVAELRLFRPQDRTVGVDVRHLEVPAGLQLLEVEERRRCRVLPELHESVEQTLDGRFDLGVLRRASACFIGCDVGSSSISSTSGAAPESAPHTSRRSAPYASVTAFVATFFRPAVAPAASAITIPVTIGSMAFLPVSLDADVRLPRAERSRKRREEPAAARLGVHRTMRE